MPMLRGRVLVLGPLPPPVHGAAVVTQGMLNWLRENGATVTVLDSSANSHGIGSIASHARAALYLLVRLWYHLVASARLLLRPDVLYIGGAGGSGLYFQVIPTFVAWVLRVPVVFHHHSSFYLDERSRPMAVLFRLTTGRSTHVALSRSMAEQLRTRYGGRRTDPRVVPLSNAIFVPAARPLPRGGGVGPVRVGHVSNLSLEKGMQEVVDTAAGLTAAGHPFELHVAGAAQDDVTRTLLDTLRGDPRVTVHGPLYGEALLDFYARLDLLLFPSRYRHEAAPMVVLEAASCGVPAVAYPIGSIPELVFAEELLAPAGGFAAHATALVGRWKQVGDELSQATLEGYRRSRDAAAEQRGALWASYLPGGSESDGAVLFSGGAERRPLS